MEKKKSGMTVIIAILVVCLVGMAGAVGYLLTRPQAQQVTESQDPSKKIAYAEGTTVVEDPDALQKAVDEMFEKAAEGNIALEYKNDASSTDGETFQCYIANSLKNSYDMYIEIFGDEELTDHLFLSGLIRPGEAFDNIKLEKKLDPGTHRVYVALTQVEEDLATLHAQVMITMDFTVN